MCSLLKNTSHLCSQANDGMAYLLLSSALEPNILNIINLILLPTKIWRAHEEENDEKKKNYSLLDISLDPTCCETNELRFSLLKTEDNESLRLNSTKLTFAEGCNFNNCIV